MIMLMLRRGVGPHHPKPLVAERSTVIHLAYAERIEGMAGISAAPPGTAAGMDDGRTLPCGNLTAAELKHIAVYIV